MGLGLAIETNHRVVLEFRSERCPACDRLQPVLDQLVQEGWVIRTVDVERERSIAERYRIRQVPTMVVRAGGEEVDRIVGYVGVEELRSRLSGRKQVPTAVVRGQSPLVEPERMPSALGPMVALNRTDAAVGLASYEAVDRRADAGRTQPNDRDGRSMAPSGNPIDAAGATVRIRVDDRGSESVGTGTIIDAHGNEYLVLTCGHLFRDGGGKSPVQVEIFQNGRAVPLSAQVVDYRADSVDIGLVVFRSPVSLPVVPLLPHQTRLQESQVVFSYGCDGGADPSRRDSKITKLNRYLGPSNVEVGGAPIQGRSGGGLFDAQGQLIGVCYAADSDYDEGLYSGPDVVYEQLNRLGLGRLYGRDTR